MATLNGAKWMIISELIWDYIDKNRWKDLSSETKDRLINGLQFDLAQTKELYKKLSLEDQRACLPEIGLAEERLKGLTAI